VEKKGLERANDREDVSRWATLSLIRSSLLGATGPQEDRQMAYRRKLYEAGWSLSKKIIAAMIGFEGL
jgi:hypothetical protein